MMANSRIVIEPVAEPGLMRIARMGSSAGPPLARPPLNRASSRKVLPSRET